MKVLILNGSPRKGGNTSIALDEMVQIFEAEGIETEVIRVGAAFMRTWAPFILFHALAQPFPLITAIISSKQSF